MNFKQVKSGQYLLYFNEKFNQLPMNEFWSRKLGFRKHGSGQNGSIKHGLESMGLEIEICKHILKQKTETVIFLYLHFLFGEKTDAIKF